MSKKLLSTQELYGVNPKTLADMKYSNALKVMKAGLWKRKRKIADDIFAATNGDTASTLQDDLRKVMKAIDITELRINEIREI